MFIFEVSLHYAELRKISYAPILLFFTDVTTFEKSSSLGSDLTYFCKYNSGNYPVICKGEDPIKCQVVATIKNERRFKMNKTEERNITITVRGITANDVGTYWCRTNPEKNKNKQELFHRFILHLGESEPSLNCCCVTERNKKHALKCYIKKYFFNHMVYYNIPCYTICYMV